MNHHLCTRCKEESYPRHKYGNGVYCEDCIKVVTGWRRPSVFGLISSMWDRVAAGVQKAFGFKSPSREHREKDRAIYQQMKTMQARARNILVDPSTKVPQKR